MPARCVGTRLSKGGNLPWEELSVPKTDIQFFIGELGREFMTALFGGGALPS